jgi:hypothetical protein
MPPQSWDVVRTQEREAAPVAIEAPRPFWSVVEANYADGWETRRRNARYEATDAALWERHRMLERQLGRRLPLSRSLAGVSPGAAERDGLERFLDSILDPEAINAAILGRPGLLEDDAYEALIEDERRKNPGLLDGIETRSALGERLAADFEATRARANAGAAQDFGGGVGAFVGQTGAVLSDPAQAGVILATGGLGAGRTLLTRMATQAAAGAGVEAQEIGGRGLDAERFGGPEYTAGEAALDVVFAGAGGAAFEPVTDAARFGLRQITRGFAGADDPAARGVADAVDRLFEDEAAIGSADDFDAARTALSRGERPPPVEPERDLDSLFADPVSGSDRQMQPGSGVAGAGADPTLTAAEYRGRAIYSGRFDPMAVEVDAARFQYKADGDAEGVTGRLRGVERWDATASGKAILFEDIDGRIIVADGHQRRGLARRLAEQGWDDAQLDGYLFRASDGWSAREVRVVAALKNIREGSGTALDAAKLFREAPQALNDRSLPISGDFMRQARDLSALSDGAFRAVVNRVIPENQAAVIGELAGGRPEIHEDLVELLRRGEPKSQDGARALVQEGLLDDFIASEGRQGDLFGGLPRESTVIARGRIREAVLAGLRKDERLNAALVRNADAIESGGNVLARTENEQRLAIDRAAGELVSRLALRAGEMGEAFGEAARAVTVGETTPAKAAKGLIARIRAAVAAGEQLDALRAERITPDAPSPAVRQALEAYDNPAGPGQKAQLEEKPEDIEVLEGEIVTDEPVNVMRGSLWELTPDELEKMLEEARASDQDKLVMALGEEGAAEFKRLDRARNNTFDTARADAASVEFDARFGKLTPDQERLVYGIGETDATAEEIETVLKAHGDILPGDPEEWAAYMAAVSARRVEAADIQAVLNGTGTAEAQAAFVRFQAASDYFTAQGVAAAELPNRMISALVTRGGWRPDQASEVIGAFVEGFNTRLRPDDAASPGLFDDLPLLENYDRAIEVLTPCAPGKGGA